MRQGVRFWPPTPPLTSEVRWALLRAFGPQNLAAQTGNPSGRLALATRLSLVPRIVARSSREVLLTELGADFEEATQMSRRSVMRGLALEMSLRHIDAAAQRLRTPYALIKGAALARRGSATLGQRGACDVDILLEHDDAIAMHDELVRAGYREKTSSHPAYHLPMLVNDSGGAIEVHTSLDFIGVPAKKGGSGTFAELRVANRLAVANCSEYCHLPSDDFLLAHALAHGIAQHGFIPQSYPLLRMMSDIIDLAIRDESRWRSAAELTAGAISPDEMSAARRLSVELTSGNFENTWYGKDGAGRLLRHLVLGSLDTSYANGLKVFESIHVLRALGPTRFLAEYGRSTFALSDQDLEKIYGPGAASPNALHKYLRPLDAVLRALRMLPDFTKIMQRKLTSAAFSKDA